MNCFYNAVVNRCRTRVSHQGARDQGWHSALVELRLSQGQRRDNPGHLAVSGLLYLAV